MSKFVQDFDINETIQSQYSASPHIVALINTFWDAINPEADIKELYEKMIDPETAIGFGLDVWGRIVAMGRELVAVDEYSKYASFAPLTVDEFERITGWDQANFYKPITGSVKLTDNAYRVYIFIKALINIGDSSLAFLNRVVNQMFPETDIKIIHIDTMALRVVIMSYLSEVDKAALLKLEWLPAGVRLEMYHIITPTLGFAGQELENWDNGTFGYTKPEIIENY